MRMHALETGSQCDEEKKRQLKIKTKNYIAYEIKLLD